MTLNDILQMLDSDAELEKMAMDGGQDDPAVVNAGMAEAAATQAGAEPAGQGAVPAATPTTGAGVDGEAAGRATSTEVAGQLGDNVEDNKIKLKEQLMEQAAAETKAKALAEKDELAGQNTAPVIGEHIQLGDTQKPMDKAAEARYEHLLELGLQKEAEMAEAKLAEDNYLLGGIFGHGFVDYVNGKEPAFQKEASILDELGSYSPEEIDAAVEDLSEEEVEKLAAAVEERKGWNKLAAHWYELGREYARGLTDGAEGKAETETKE